MINALQRDIDVLLAEAPEFNSEEKQRMRKTVSSMPVEEMLRFYRVLLRGRERRRQLERRKYSV